jgi:hypothetical protein
LILVNLPTHRFNQLFPITKLPMAATFVHDNVTVGAETGVRSRAWKAWQATSKAAKPFFFAPNAQRSTDQLVQVVRRDPAMGAKVLQGVTFFSVLGNFVVTITILIFLSRYWSTCGGCDRPLRWWLLMLSVLQTCQIPVRVVFLASVRGPAAAARNEGGDGHALEECVTSLTASPAWVVSKKVALVQYAWFVLGMVWWMHSTACPDCPGIGQLTAGVMILVAGRAATAMAVVTILFSPLGANSDEALEADAKKVAAATTNQISALPVVRFQSSAASASKPTAGDDGEDEAEAPTCSICLTEFEDGAIMRRLPCGHDFHRRCVDKWLHLNKRCPLCVHPIDDPSPMAAGSMTPAGAASPWSASKSGACCGGRGFGLGSAAASSPKGVPADGRAK